MSRQYASYWNAFLLREILVYCCCSLLPANEIWGKVIFSVVCVKNSVHRGGVPGQIHPPGRYTPEQVHPRPLGRYTPWQVHPPGRYTPWAGTPPPPGAVHAGRYGQQAGDTHPTECILVIILWLGLSLIT